MGLRQIKKLLHSKGNNYQTIYKTRQHTKWEKIFARHLLDKEYRKNFKIKHLKENSS
jgi:hypothetical protein